MESQKTNRKANAPDKNSTESKPDKEMTSTGDSQIDLNTINGWMDKTKDMYVGMFENQVKNQYDFYNSIMNTLSETTKNNWKPGMNYTDLFLGYNPKSLELLSPLSDGALTDYYNQYGKTMASMMDQVMDFDQKLFDLLSQEVKSSEKGWSRSNEVLKNAIENRLNASKSILKSNMEILNKQINHSTSKVKKQKEEEVYA